MALTTSAGPNWISQYGAARNKAKSALQKGTVEADIDWAELQLLAERAGVADLFSREDLVQENYVPEYQIYDGQQSAIGPSAGTAATFDDEEEADEVAAVPAAYTQEEFDSVDLENTLFLFDLLSGDMQTTIDNLQNAVSTGRMTPAEEAVLTGYLQRRGLERIDTTNSSVCYRKTLIAQT